MRELKRYNEEKIIFFDIETARSIKTLELDTPLFDSWEYKVNKDGSKSNEEIIASYEKEAGLYPEFAKIVSIVVGKIKDGRIHLITLDDPDEKKILNDFNAVLERNTGNTLAGFVNLGFDTPYIFRRMIINGIQPHSKVDHSGLKPWEIDEIDLSKLWQGTSFNRASLINIATAFGIPSPKDDISGADVGNVYWNEGEAGLRRISKYCRKDVATTINIFKKMRLEDTLEVATEEPLELEDIPLLQHLFSGGKFGKEEKEELTQIVSMFSEEERKYAFTVLDAAVSTAKGKKTKITKTFMKSLKAKKFD